MTPRYKRNAKYRHKKLRLAVAPKTINKSCIEHTDVYAFICHTKISDKLSKHSFLNLSQRRSVQCANVRTHNDT